MCAVTMDYTFTSLWNPLALDQISRLPSESQARKSSGVHHLLQIMSFQQPRRTGYTWALLSRGETQGVHLAELCWASPTCHLWPFLPSAKDAPDSTALNTQMQPEEAWGYPLCSGTRWCATAQKKHVDAQHSIHS